MNCLADSGSKLSLHRLIEYDGPTDALSVTAEVESRNSFHEKSFGRYPVSNRRTLFSPDYVQ